jgi:hypothetical protein
VKDVKGNGCGICEGSATAIASTDPVQLRKTFRLLGRASIPDFLNTKSGEGYI